MLPHLIRARNTTHAHTHSLSHYRHRSLDPSQAVAVADAPLQMPLDGDDGDAAERPDWVNYGPMKPRPDRRNAFPERNRVRPIDDWAGEQPLYK